MLTFRIAAVIALSASLVSSTGCQDAGATNSGQQKPQALNLTLPNKEGSFKFAVHGDFGTGDRTQYQLADIMGRVHDKFKYSLVVLVGDNLYGSERPQDFKKKFEDPYKKLLDAGVKFYASLGNHDAREQRFYKPSNMDGN